MVVATCSWRLPCLKVTSFRQVPYKRDRFLMVAPDPAQSERVHVVLNWSEELKRLVPTEN